MMLSLQDSIITAGAIIIRFYHHRIPLQILCEIVSLQILLGQDKNLESPHPLF
ncbi:hypothetical protein [Helicobacter sp. MIT 14-3879]|uniref:hypothetical protein n=1 Tax=Helicobacter sp. MIT 14-3879 TaxID=2040649 RepID=UPI0015F1B591|nr:hypothetical protein [Helicobacter sp. MIT 14-3879]